jgi:hypothetical protein
MFHDVRVWDLQPSGHPLPEENQSWPENHPEFARQRWRPGNPPMPPQQITMPRDTAMDAVERNPERYRLVTATDEEHAELLRRFRERAVT